MTSLKHALAAATMAATLSASGLAWAADPAKPDAQNPTPQQTAADKDFAKLSNDGARGFYDMVLTRVAIYEGRTDEAKDLINKASAALAKAKSDDSVFMKAESDLKQPATKGGDAKTADAKPANGDQAKTPIAWLPVDASITVNEDYTASPAKSAAVADANKSIKGGGPKGAVEKLRLANMSTDVVLAVVPLDQTIASVQKAASLINDGKYYEASQELRQAQTKERLDLTTVPGAGG